MKKLLLIPLSFLALANCNLKPAEREALTRIGEAAAIAAIDAAKETGGQRPNK